MKSIHLKVGSLLYREVGVDSISTDSWTTIPRYLYRTYSESSQGHNSPEYFESGAMSAGLLDPSSTQFDMSRERARWSLLQHQLWLREDPSPFVSMTSSLMFALQLAIHRKYHLKEVNVGMCVLAVHRVNSQNVFPTRNLFKAYKITWNARAYRHCYNVEYLVFGALATGCVLGHATLAHLELHNFREKYPEFYEERGQRLIGARVVQLRNRNFLSPVELCLYFLGR